MDETNRNKDTLYVAGLAHEVDQSILQGAFLPFGEIAVVSIPKSELRSSAEPHRGFGYVKFEDPTDAIAAIDNMNGSELFGRVLTVAIAKPQKRQNEGLGSKVALWQQEGYLAEHAEEQQDKASASLRPVRDSAASAQDAMQGLETMGRAGPEPER